MVSECVAGIGVVPEKFVFAIYFPLPGAMDSPFTNGGYFGAYRSFGSYCTERGVDLRIVRGDSYEGGMEFSNGWRFNHAGDLHPVGPLKADYILNKSGMIQSFDADASVLNDPYLEHICSDKLVMYEAFQSLMPRTVPYVPGRLDLAKDVLHTDMIVLKPCGGSAGRGIVIVDRDHEVSDQIGLVEPYLAQEFIDTTKGIPGVVEGTHDLRIIMVNGEARLAFTRVPKKGSLLANVAKGGSLVPVDIETLPNSVLVAAEEIDQKFLHCTPRFYSADFMYEDGVRPYLVELNSRPGFPTVACEGGAFCKDYFDRLFEIIR